MAMAAHAPAAFVSRRLKFDPQLAMLAFYMFFDGVAHSKLHLQNGCTKLCRHSEHDLCST